MKAAVIVAHPDDEVIWCGGLILRHPEWQWTVLSLCRADDADRAPKFRRVCRALGAQGLISNLDDSPELRAIDVMADLGGRVLDLLPPTRWDLCLTHGANGEYGHERHRQAHQAVTALARNGRLAADRLWAFAYHCEAETGTCRPGANADLTVALSPEQLTRKKTLVRDEYGYPEEGFEVRACTSPEAFTVIRRSDKELAL